MAAALIVIEIAAPSVSDDALMVLVSACTRAARDAECVLAKNAGEAQPAAVAIVSQQAEDKLRVEVGVRQGDRDSWRTKDFAFLAADQIADRWRAVGFAIGTLAENDVPAADRAPLAEKRSLPPIAPPKSVLTPSGPPKPTPKIPSRPQLFAGAGAIFGPGLDSGPWRLGSEGYAALAPWHWPVFFTLGGSAATRVKHDQRGAAARWFDISGGVGVRLLGALASSGLELGAQAIAEEFDVSVSEPDGRTQGMGRWIFGVQGELGGRVRLVPDLFLTLSVTAADLSSATDVRVGGVPVGSAESVRYLGSFGLRARLR